MKTNIKMNINVNSPLSLCVVLISSLLLSIQELSATQQSPNNMHQFEVQGVQQEKITLITMKDNKNLFQTMARIAVGQKQYDNFFPVLFEEEQGWSAEKLITLSKNDISHMQAIVLYAQKDNPTPQVVYISGSISETKSKRSHQVTPTSWQQPIIEEVDDEDNEVKKVQKETYQLVIEEVDDENEQKENLFAVQTTNTTNNNNNNLQMRLDKANQNLEAFKQRLSRSITNGFNTTMQLNKSNLQARLKRMKEKNNQKESDINQRLDKQLKTKNEKE